MKKRFNPEEWREPAQPQKFPNNSLQTEQITHSSDDVEIVTQRIETAAKDITGDYSTWRDLGFALSDELGENGRSYFHRISRFYEGYTEKETNNQYDRCLRSHGTGISIKTFYKIAKDSGINISVPSKTSFPSHTSFSPTEIYSDNLSQFSANGGNENFDGNERNEAQQFPTFAREIRNLLPEFLQKIVDQSDSKEDADILLLGSLTVISAVLPNVSGVYNKRPTWANLFLFITARASSGKGRLSLCKFIADPIHNRMREINEAEEIEYEQKMKEYQINKKKLNIDKPKEPPLRMLFIPANSSATAVYQVLGDNDGQGIMFETEGDTLANTFASDYGNYSDGFRKAFHHENISYVRRKDREYVNLKNPRLSCLLTGTPKQVQSLITDTENGLFSRFIFYHLNTGLEWQNVFEKNEDGTVDNYFIHLGEQYYDFYKILCQIGNIGFHLTLAQENSFNDYFSEIHNEYQLRLGEEIIASIRRLGLITFRIAMILSSIRMMDNNSFKTDLECTDDDFNAAMTISKALICHTAFVFSQLPSLTSPKNSGCGQKTVRRQLFLDTLPDEFDRKTFIDISSKLGMPLSTAERNIKKWIEEGLLERRDFGQYKKLK